MELAGLVPLGDYRAPALPTEEKVSAAFARLKAMFLARSGQDVIASDRLETPSLRRLDEAAQPPACAPLLNDLDLAMRQWLERPVAAGTVLAVITPPSDRSDVVGSWAAQAGLRPMSPPTTRTGELDLNALQNMDDREPLVVPRLEKWFIRSPEGIERMRKLLTILSVKRRVLIGCNSFAWAFFVKAIRLDLIAPGPFTFRPFDGAMLEQWLVELASDEIADGAGFRLADSGGYLLREGAEQETSHFFQTLAGRSLGIPSIAWHMWRDMLRIDDIDEHADGSQGQHSKQRETFWIAAMDELVLPGTYPRELLFALHALCLHGSLTPQELLSVVPETAGVGVVPALRGSRFVQFENGALGIRPEAYPSVRAGLQTSGFPMGAI